MEQEARTELQLEKRLSEATELAKAEARAVQTAMEAPWVRGPGGTGGPSQAPNVP